MRALTGRDGRALLALVLATWTLVATSYIEAEPRSESFAMKGAGQLMIRFDELDFEEELVDLRLEGVDARPAIECVDLRCIATVDLPEGGQGEVHVTDGHLLVDVFDRAGRLVTSSDPPLLTLTAGDDPVTIDNEIVFSGSVPQDQDPADIDVDGATFMMPLELRGCVRGLGLTGRIALTHSSDDQPPVTSNFAPDDCRHGPGDPIGTAVTEITCEASKWADDTKFTCRSTVPTIITLGPPESGTMILGNLYWWSTSTDPFTRGFYVDAGRTTWTVR